jgi:hypothetical protein
MQAGAVDGQVRQVVVSLGRLAAESPAPWRPCALAGRQGQAIDDGESGIVRNPIATPLPQPIFDQLEVCALTPNSRPVQMGEHWEAGRSVAAEVANDRGIVLQPEILADHLQGEQCLKSFVNHTEPRDNT